VLTSFVKPLQTKSRFNPKNLIQDILAAPLLSEELFARLLSDEAKLTEETVIRLLRLASSTQSPAMIQTLIDLKIELQNEPAFQTLLDKAVAAPHIDHQVLQDLDRLLHRHPQKSDLIAMLQSLKHAQTPFFKALETLLNKVKDEPAQNEIITILSGTCWRKEDVPLKRQIALIDTLKTRTAEELQLLSTLYQQKPAPSLTALENVFKRKPNDLTTWIKNYELDPWGKRDTLVTAYSLQGVEALIADIKPLLQENEVPEGLQGQLLDAYTYLVGISNTFKLPVAGALKPINAFTHQELKDYLKQTRKKIKQNPGDLKSKTEALAIFCEALFRTTGKYPYPNQIMSVLTTLCTGGNTLLQIPTGQGKSIINALLGAMHFTCSAKKVHVSVTSQNLLLIERDYTESRDFFDYFNLKTALVTAGSEDNVYSKPTLVYTTPADESLYRSKLKMGRGILPPSKQQQIIIADEIDAEIYDNENAFNLAEGNDDPFFNPLSWLYPIVNDFVDDPVFLNDAIDENADLIYLVHRLKTQAKDQYNRHQELLTPLKLNQLINAACLSKQLRENEDFVVRKRDREVHGKMETISEAHLLVHHIEDKSATLSDGVQQSLHARLEKERKKSTPELPAFSCDNEIDRIDSQNTKSYFSKFGRTIGTTGTPGSKAELQDAKKTYHFKNLFAIPPRQKSKLRILETLFCDEKSSFFFQKKTQTDALLRTLKAHRKQPTLITCKDINTAETFRKNLVKKFGDTKVQVIHAKNADDLDFFEEAVKNAAEPGMITIVTPLAGRGVDIKTKPYKENPQHSKAQKKLEILAENLLVIETSIERYRGRQQIQGRTARDGKTGTTIGIFNLSDLAMVSGKDTKKLSRNEKFKLIDDVMVRLDEDAAKERALKTHIKDIVFLYQNTFDALLQKAPLEAKKNIIAMKKEFMIEADQLWQNLDPQAKMSPLESYQEQVHRLFVQYRKKPALTKLPAPFEDPATVTAKAIHFETQGLETLEEHLLNVFITQQEQGHPSDSAYLNTLKLEQSFVRQLKPWIENNPNIPSAFKTWTKAFTSLRQQALSVNEPQILTFVKSLNTFLNSRQDIDAKSLALFLDLNALAYQDFLSNQNLQLSSQDEEALKTALDVLETRMQGPQSHKSFQHFADTLHLLTTKKPEAAQEENTLNEEAKAYLADLNTTLQSLEKRAKRSSLFVNKKLYPPKIEALKQHIETTKALLKNQGPSSLKNTIHAMQVRAEQDTRITTNTSRFFKLKRQTTTNKDIQDLSRKHLRSDESKPKK